MTDFTCPWCLIEGYHDPGCEGLRRFFAGEAVPIPPPCDCHCHQIVRPGLVPCPSCATDPDHSSRYDAPPMDGINEST